MEKTPSIASAILPFNDPPMRFYYLSDICRAKPDYNRLKSKNAVLDSWVETEMGLVRKERAFEGVPASSAIAMAVMEESGIRELIDSQVRWDSERKLSPGNAVMAMIGPIFDHRKKLPLSGIREFYRGAPTDMLFGEGVTEESLNDKALARNLDSLHDAGLEELYWSCSRKIKSHYGFDSHVRHMDSTNYTVHAVPPDDPGDGTAVPAYGGNAKDGRNDLLQYCAATVTDGDRVLEYCRAYSGNTSDVVMNEDTLGFLIEHLDPRNDTVIADSKLVNERLISTISKAGMGFISKVPAIFSDRIRDVIIQSALTGLMDDVLEGYQVYDTEADTICGKLRFIAYRSPKGTGRAMDYLERQGLKEAERRFRPLTKRTFACHEDASRALEEVMRTHRDSAYDVFADIVATEVVRKRASRGRPSKDAPPPETFTEWTIETRFEFNRSRAEFLVAEHDLGVIVTNIPFANEDEGNVRHGATTSTVLRLYLDQYKVEHTYRLMKSGMGVDSVYVRTPKRADALLFVVAVATLVSSIIDALLAKSRDCPYRTVKKAAEAIQHASFEFHRDTGDITVTGPAGSVDRVFAYIDGIGLDPSHLFEK